jgi:hypothetical protein
MNEIKDYYYAFIQMLILLISPFIVLIILGYFINLTIDDTDLILSISLIIFLLYVCIFLKFTIVDE